MTNSRGQELIERTDQEMEQLNRQMAMAAAHTSFHARASSCLAPPTYLFRSPRQDTDDSGPARHCFVHHAYVLSRAGSRASSPVWMKW